MIPIARFVMNIGRALRVALPVMLGSSSLVSNPLRLARVVLGGERRRRASEKRLGVPVPRFCIISVTWKCNLVCVGCYTKNYSRDSELSLESLERVIREANRLGSFFFIIVGGEPLMAPGLIEVLGKFNQALFFMFTNGTLVHQAHVDAIKVARNILPIISLEGDGAHTDHRRGGGVGEKVAKAMGRFRKARVPFGFSTMVTHRNLRYVTTREWFDGVWNAGARFGFLIDYVPVLRDADPDMMLTDEDRRFKSQAVEKRFYEARPMALNIPPDEYTTGECQAAGKGMMHINADGNVEPCPFCHYAADNIRDKRLPDILASPFFARLRSQFGRLPNPRGECLLFTHIEKVRTIAAQTRAFSTERLSGKRSPGTQQAAV